MGIGRHHQPVPGRNRQKRTIVALVQERVVEFPGKQFLDQLDAEPATGTMVHVDHAVPKVQRAQIRGLVPAHATTTGMSRQRP